MSAQFQTEVMEVQGVNWASSKAVAESVLSRRAGVLNVDANPIAQTASVTFDPRQISIAELTTWVRDCGYHCAGRSVPQHVCDPMEDVDATASPTTHGSDSRDAVARSVDHEGSGHGAVDAMTDGVADPHRGHGGMGGRR